MATNRLVKVRQNLTFIGTANKDVRETVHDETGNRRLLQIDMISPLHPDLKAFWAAVNGFDWVGLWRAVDDTLPDPTGVMAERLRGIQTEQRSLSQIEIWVEHMHGKKSPLLLPGAFTLSEEMFQDFTNWESVYGPAMKTTYKQFTNTLARLARSKYVPFRNHQPEGKGRGYVALRPGDSMAQP